MIFAHWFPAFSNFNQGHPFCNNANAAIRRKLWQQQPYNETLPGLEDLAWAQWAHDQGLRIAYVAEAEIVHVHHESWRGIANRYRREGMAFKMIYPQAQFGLGEMVRTFLTNSLQDFREAKRQKCFTKYWKPILGFRWNQFYGTYQGYQHSGPLTWQLKQAFYYPRLKESGTQNKRQVKPIEYQDRTEKGSS
jgi:hypothetical protein